MYKKILDACAVAILGFVAVLLIGGGTAQGQHQFPTAEVPTSEPAYLAKVKTAAPAEIAGSNGFTCLISPDGTPLCADANALEWMKSIGARSAPPDKIGFIYMLAGDTGTTNHDPHQRDTRLHWVQTGPHVMIVGPRVREMMGYPRSLDVADPSQPYVMYPGTPYEHLMLPTK
jgi:hypothetical protein